MWTSGSCNHASEHHSPLSSQPHIVITAVLGLRSADPQHPSAAALDGQWQTPHAPILDRAAGTDRAGPAGQRFTLDSALIGSHAPGTGLAARNEVDVGARGRERRGKPQRPAALHQIDQIHVVDQHDQMWYADLGEDRLLLAGTELEP